MPGLFNDFDPVAMGYQEVRPGRRRFPFPPQGPPRPGRPARPARPARPGAITLPGFTPDYLSLIENDPAFSFLKNSLGASSVSSAAQRAAQIRRALIDFGDTGGATDPYGDIDATTAGLAEANTTSGLSSVAKMKREHELALTSLRNSLAARGILSSGETGYQTNEENRGYTDRQSSSRTQLLDYLNGVSQAFAQGEAERQGQLATGYQAAYQNQLGLPQNQPVAAQNLTQAGTSGYYKGPDGSLYEQNGAKVNVPQALANYQDTVKNMRKRGLSDKQIKSSWQYQRLQLLGGN